jgi:hypothetical protein
MLLNAASAKYVGHQQQQQQHLLQWLKHYHGLLQPVSCKDFAHLEADVAAVLPGAVVARLCLLQLQGPPSDCDPDLYYVAKRKPYKHWTRAQRKHVTNQSTVHCGAALGMTMCTQTASNAST